MPFTFYPLEIPGLVLVEPTVFPDARGHFLETFKESDFRVAGIDLTIVQVNESVSRSGVIRGLHYQIPPHAQGKLVRVPRGRVQDIAVDLRRDSETFAKHVSVELSADNRRALWIPPGFAHGACSLEDESQLLYLVTGSEYAPDSERGIHPLDDVLGIRWQVPHERREISSRDLALPSLASVTAELDALEPSF